MMGRIGSRDTKPEMIIRRGLHRLGFRFRLHGKDLAGKPDIILPKYQAVIFIHGCFWHAHQSCPYFRLPKTRTDFWVEKLAKNTERDARSTRKLIGLGWRVLTVWECSTRTIPAEKLAIRIAEWLQGDEISGEIATNSGAA